MSSNTTPERTERLETLSCRLGRIEVFAGYSVLIAPPLLFLLSATAFVLVFTGIGAIGGGGLGAPWRQWAQLTSSAVLSSTQQAMYVALCLGSVWFVAGWFSRALLAEAGKIRRKSATLSSSPQRPPRQ
jgi:hypothetical protein